MHPPSRDIFIYLYGGLGNQLFQAAFALALEERLNAEVKFIVDSYKDEGPHGLMLPCFPTLRPRIVPLSDALGAPMINENAVRHFPPDQLLTQLSGLMEQSGRLFFWGFWQNEAYFFGLRDKLRPIFQPLVKDATAAEAAAIAETETIGIHLRRRNYGHMGLARTDYYRQAIEAIRKERGPLPVLCFSDEPGFCQYVFRDIDNLTVSGNSDFTRPLDDFAKLMACRHHVIANSTFSWWPAWLAEQSDSIIYAPSPWVFPDPLTNPVPARWRSLSDAVQRQ
ncbi:MAG TPA: alpha-1,2-fucosyltransferase [Rhodospirillaceae bacterium]|nr:alpha-1,2-fucosyltransferase [Rhodospirillaceae bacterium]